MSTGLEAWQARHGHYTILSATVKQNGLLASTAEQILVSQ